uniref:Uncharacterized protein n=1 Tax=Heterorhabditis bacteriophora TaxID=37862 RepID=A0A1I7WRJ7_HETBA
MRNHEYVAHLTTMNGAVRQCRLATSQLIDRSRAFRVMVIEIGTWIWYRMSRSQVSTMNQSCEHAMSVKRQKEQNKIGLTQDNFLYSSTEKRNYFSVNELFYLRNITVDLHRIYDRGKIQYKWINTIV